MGGGCVDVSEGANLKGARDGLGVEGAIWWLHYRSSRA